MKEIPIEETKNGYSVAKCTYGRSTVGPVEGALSSSELDEFIYILGYEGLPSMASVNDGKIENDR